VKSLCITVNCLTLVGVGGRIQAQISWKQIVKDSHQTWIAVLVSSGTFVFDIRFLRWKFWYCSEGNMLTGDNIMNTFLKRCRSRHNTLCTMRKMQWISYLTKNQPGPVGCLVQQDCRVQYGIRCMRISTSGQPSAILPVGATQGYANKYKWTTICSPPSGCYTRLSE
jgi:hypothetical protein